jgi:hypothetical protein
MRPRKQARRRWEPEEEQQLRQMAEAGKRVTTMALRPKRTTMAVRQRLHILKIHLRDDKEDSPGA